ncbi:MAG: prepilin-type N-terminal cleavage/methylation domain-containing protein [Planctomycetes bacterium]|nr:prepilin-type N-terminal cleavage/methylation domain-containing protein [Planctomycetota bacterium]
MFVDRAPHTGPSVRGNIAPLGTTTGFTLIELLVVISIIIVISLASLPTFLNMMKTRGLRDGASAVQRAILQAQTQAVAKRRPFLVEFVDITATSADPSVSQWKIQIVDSHEDKNNDGDPFDPGTRGVDPNDDEVVAEMMFVPKLSFQGGVQGGVTANRIGRGSSFTDASGNVHYGTIVFLGDGSALLRMDCMLSTYPMGTANDVSTELFDPEFAGGDPAANHDFQLLMGEDRVYFNIVPATGRTSAKNNFE